MGLILATRLSALNVDMMPFFLLAAYMVVEGRGVRAHTKAWNAVTVNTPTRLNTALVCLDTQLSRFCKKTGCLKLSHGPCLLQS